MTAKSTTRRVGKVMPVVTTFGDPAEYDLVTCSGCERTQRGDFSNGGLLPCGWIVPYEDFGYYNGFSDNIEVLYNTLPSKTWVLCHDCVVILLGALPLLAKKIPLNSHYCDEDKPCCEWAWQGTGLYGTGIAGVLTRHPENGKWVDDPPVDPIGHKSN